MSMMPKDLAVALLLSIGVYGSNLNAQSPAFSVGHESVPFLAMQTTIVPGVNPADASLSAEASGRRQDACQRSSTQSAAFRPIDQIPLGMRGDGQTLPPDCSQTLFHGDNPASGSRFGSYADFYWQPTNLSHRPTYFEDVALERYGQSRLPIAQPLVSGAKFAATFPIWPYKMALERPHSCVTTMGYAPPGSCTECVRENIPWRWDAALFEAAVVTGLVFALP